MKYIKSKLLSKFSNIVHFFTTKKCGNIAFHVNDNEESVINNHIKIAKDFHYNHNKLIWMKQIHSDKVEIINSENNFTNVPICDALITDKKNVPIMVMVADCTPIILYDYKNQLISVIHAGRKGAFENIVSKTVKTMQKNYQSNIKNIIAILGPSIKSCCYEVGEEINEEAKKLQLDFAITKKSDKFYLNINIIIKTQLKTLGVLNTNIEELKHCTSCENNILYSYRAAKDENGRNAGVIILK